MSRDYAPRGGGSRRPTRKTTRNRNSGVPGWIWMIAGLSFGLTVAAFVYIHQPAPAMNGHADDTAATGADDSDKGHRKDRKKSQALPLPPKEKERFTFYEILKNQEVVLPNEAVKSSKPPSTPAPTNPATPPPANAGDGNTGSYIIQVASFRSQSEAEKQKAGLALLGVESRIESVTIDGKNTFYRVRIGPDSNWKHVQATMARLESSGIQALLVKVN